MKLHEQNAEMKATLAEIEQEVRDFKTYLHSAKFLGELNDNIATHEVLSHLRRISDMLTVLEDKGIQITKEETCQHDAQ